MIRQISIIVVLVFSVFALLTAAGPLYEGVSEPIQDSDEVQEQGHVETIDSIIKAVLIYAPLTLVLGFIGWAFVWVVRRERRVGRRR
jgi:hypothetical protein